MKIYGNQLSPNSRRAMLVARHLELDVAFETVDFASGGLHKPEFLALNPNGRVPVLVDEDFVLTESRAIVQYLALEKPGLMPDDDNLRCDVSRWQFWDAEHFAHPIGTIAFEKLLKPMMGLGDPSPAVVADALKLFERGAKVIDAHLGKHEWLVGNALSVADLTVAASLTYATPCELPLDQYVNLKAWFGRIRELPAWQATEPKMG